MPSSSFLRIIISMGRSDHWYHHVNGKAFPIQHNLFHGLLSIRDFLSNERRSKELFSEPNSNYGPESSDTDEEPRPCYLWIDAICIDQANTDEKTAQVALMPKIYSHARKVIVWLGSRGQASDLAVDTLNDGNFEQLFINPSVQPLEGVPDDPFLEGSLEERRVAVLGVCNRPYWKRVWIVHEILKALRLTFLCGHKCFSWTRAKELLSAADSESFFIEKTWFYVAFFATSAAKLLIWKRRWDDAREASLFTGRRLDPVYRLDKLMEDLALRGSTDPRDRVFALVGLAHSPQAGRYSSWLSLPAADYSRSRESVFADVMACIYDVPDRKDLVDLWRFVMLVQGDLEVDDTDEEVESAKVELIRHNIDSSLLTSTGNNTSFAQTYAEALLFMDQARPDDSALIEDFLAFLSRNLLRPKIRHVPLLTPEKRRLGLELEDIMHKKRRTR